MGKRRNDRRRSGEREAKSRRHEATGGEGSASATGRSGHHAARERRCEEFEKLESGTRWQQWGPYLSERQWGTLREDYSSDGNCWEYFSHEDATSRAYRWGEDGLMGICDSEARLCVALALWNGKDKLLKERLFGLTQPQGNHGEDVKECYYYLDSTPTHSYMKALYKYPQQEFPYQPIIKQNAQRGLSQREYELEDTGIFDENSYWDVYTEYAKISADQIACRVTVHNRGPDPATLHVLPHVWFRNTWSWGSETDVDLPEMKQSEGASISLKHPALGRYNVSFDVDEDGKEPEILFTNNDTNMQKIFNQENKTPYTKDAFHRYLIQGDKAAVNPEKHGTKCAALYRLALESGKSASVQFCLNKMAANKKTGIKFGKQFEKIFVDSKEDADLYYSKVLSSKLTEEESNMARQACAGLLWTKQFFYHHVKDWMHGLTENTENKKLAVARTQTNHRWQHMKNHDIISMPDKWEFPWVPSNTKLDKTIAHNCKNYAVWDLAFHMLPFSRVDQEFAKKQLLLFLSDRYLHPNGQLPAYEFDFSDVNPPVHAWACLRVYSAAPSGERDVVFLKQCFNKLLLNFSWWVNKKDAAGNHVFSGGFLGMDNISAIHRSQDVPGHGRLAQADGTAWMAFYCTCMLQMALELANQDSSYSTMVVKFINHFSNIAKAMNDPKNGLWSDEDGFYYDCIIEEDDKLQQLQIRSLVGLVSMFSCLLIEESDICELKDVQECIASLDISITSKVKGKSKQALLSVPTKHQLKQLIGYLTQEEEFLSAYGIRSLSKVHEKKPFSVTLADEKTYSISYASGESNSDMFGGNSNWRGPIWICMNYLLIESLERYGGFYGDDLTVEYPSGSGVEVTLDKVAHDIAERIVSIFMPDKNGNRPVHGGAARYANDANWADLVLFNEYFDGDSGRGCGASHQTGWTALVICLLDKVAQRR